ncbi:3-hydroxyisobutyrate dehydrogenase-like beta-hydroxyacid dehydrogenase [Saccharothrix tamanrassetensis]|uniref:3-hydroxyisobutyrate dehydrogenase-like beta-hydroxyacid dehydrogenase n=1 Tax=Saccharothrix tamanrassetensis TaxID=1051531 RepID=A0A841CGT6_9PSEU|nr:NAD(P)-binding domain-containing protein [Saccharothrix tamanrassetensis]MBB5954916.1 3-hydroxyisobutyrate dehydrogenase-like beta-hydroxyacid dehydrogenase [Saccharothrix tamanrassetensis]
MSTPLTVIGLGPMGQAMVAKFLEHGHPTTVWNRTASRADALVEQGATRAATVQEALDANRLIVLSLTDYAAMYEILDGRTIAGKTIVNLSSDTPETTVKAAAWLAERGAELLAGGLMVPAPLVGAEGAYAFYSGPKDVFEANEDVLEVVGRPDYLGEDHSLAQLFYLAQLDFFLTTLAAMLHSIALVKTAGVSAAQFAPYLKDNAQSITMYFEETISNIDRGQYPGDLANILMMGASADHVVGASEATGVDAELPKAIQSLYRRGIAAGHGRDNWTALYNVVKPGGK